MISSPDSAVLIIFCKRPKVGVGKQRVAAELGGAAALELSSLLLDAALEDASDWPGPVVIAPADPDDSEWAEALLADTTVIPQKGRNLGERLNHVDRELRDAGRENLIFIGTDAPGLCGNTLAESAQMLADHGAVIIPATDGGVTLLGSREPWPRLDELAWETNRLGTELTELCEQNGMTVGVMPTDSDIDHYNDLLAARDRLRQDSRPSRQALVAWADRQLSISIIVPVMRDSAALQRLLDHLAPLLARRDEIIVVDVEQSQSSADTCAHFGARYLSKPASRGARMNFGAATAANRILWFIHADAQPDATAPDLIRQTIGSGTHAGYFKFRFSGERSLPRRTLESAINLRASIGIPYGDQALFMTCPAFEQAGGYADTTLFEEVALVKALQRAGNFKRLPATIGVSPRRWERDGWFKRTLQNRLLVLGHWLGVPSTVLTQMYHGSAQQSATTNVAENKRP